MPDPMTASALLEIIAPHRDMLREMGWGLQKIADKCESLVYVVRYSDHGVSHDDVDTDLAARILADVCMEELEKWAFRREWTACVYECGGDFVAYADDDFTPDEKHSGNHAGSTRLAALLALLAWTKTADAGRK